MTPTPIMTPVELTRRAAAAARTPWMHRALPHLADPLADALDAIADFAEQPGVPGPQPAILAVCWGVLHTAAAELGAWPDA